MAVYRAHGHDRLSAVRWVVDQAGPLVEPVLDTGTGKGLLALEFARRGFDVVSVDVSAEQQRIAALNAEHERLRSRVALVRAHAGRLAFRDAVFGCVATMDTLHHLRDAAPILTEAVRVLRPGGTLLLAEFTRQGFEIVDRVHREEGRRHPVGPVTLSWAEAFLRSRGLAHRASARAHEHAVVVFERPRAC
jgi:ubiquinone/menaquinone biosynthesis C-methylase UbiE